MTPSTDFSAHTLNLKLALRSLKKRCEKAEEQLGREAAIQDTGILSEVPFTAGLVCSKEYVIDLLDDVVFIIELGQFGIPYANKEARASFIPISASKLVAALTQDITDQDEAFAALERFYKAVMNLP
ncbi:hypothetical protein D3C85_1047340 [compost metagenome]